MTELSEREQAFAIKLQEAFAAFLDHTDAQLGRLLDALADLGLDANTLVIATSDNGASQEGNETGVLDEFRHFNGFPKTWNLRQTDSKTSAPGAALLTIRGAGPKSAIHRPNAINKHHGGACVIRSLFHGQRHRSRL